MSQAPKPLGSIVWTDLTVPDAVALRDFYAAVAGWTPSPVSMGEYEDFVMMGAGGEAAAGVCHQRGTNAGLPAQWLVYVTVSALDERLDRCRALGGAVLVGPKSMGAHGRYAVIRDPAGAVMALIEPPPA
jgi:predicted enzyme related to lactoylglutathione lyase